MKEFITSHTYLVSSSIGALFYLTGLLFNRKSINPILISSVMASPQGFLALILSPVYWNPKRIMFLGIGVEDILFCFVVGGLVWMAISTVFQDKIVYDNDVKRILLRYLICSLTGILITFILYYSGFKSMVNPFITMTIWISVLIVIKKKYLIICLTGSFVFLLIYTITFIIVSKIWPDLLLFWTHENLSGHTFMKIPIEELIWAFLYGGSWSAAMAFILRVNFKSTLSSIKDPIQINDDLNFQKDQIK